MMKIQINSVVWKQGIKRKIWENEKHKNIQKETFIQMQFNQTSFYNWEKNHCMHTVIKIRFCFTVIECMC